MPKNSRWGRQYVSEEASMLAARLVRRLKKEGWSLSVAESCTGGLLASSFTDISGASEWFSQGWVTYSNESKISMLGVNPKKLEKLSQYEHSRSTVFGSQKRFVKKYSHDTCSSFSASRNVYRRQIHC